MARGTLTLADLQATLNAQTVARVGEDTTWEAIQNTLDAHNRIMREMYSEFVRPTTEEAERYGGPDAMTMEDGDETSRPRAQKVTAGQTVGFPLNLADVALQWTDLWFKKHTIGQLAAQMNAVMDADANRLIRDMKRALYRSANYTHTDHLARGIDLAVKRLVNADSQPLPVGPNGEVFTAATHTHYLARAGGAIANTDYDAGINTIKEHYSTGEIQVFINQADEPTVRGFAGFVGYPDPRLILANTTINPRGRTLDVVNLYNRAIGLYNGAEVVVKPWAIASYPFIWNASAEPPLVYRYDPDYGDGLQAFYDNGATNSLTPLRAKGFRRIFGIGVKNRVNGAIVYHGNTTYADPTIN